MSLLLLLREGGGGAAVVSRPIDGWFEVSDDDFEPDDGWFDPSPDFVNSWIAAWLDSTADDDEDELLDASGQWIDSSSPDWAGWFAADEDEDDELLDASWQYIDPPPVVILNDFVQSDPFYELDDDEDDLDAAFWLADESIPPVVVVPPLLPGGSSKRKRLPALKYYWQAERDKVPTLYVDPVPELAQEIAELEAAAPSGVAVADLWQLYADVNALVMAGIREAAAIRVELAQVDALRKQALQLEEEEAAMILLGQMLEDDE